MEIQKYLFATINKLKDCSGKSEIMIKYLNR